MSANVALGLSQIVANLTNIFFVHDVNIRLRRTRDLFENVEKVLKDMNNSEALRMPAGKPGKSYLISTQTASLQEKSYEIGIRPISS